VTADTSGAEIISIGDIVGFRADQDATAGLNGFYHYSTGWRTTQTGVLYAGTGWHHVVYLMNDTGNSQKIYVDGQEIASNTYTESISYSGQGVNTFIGRHGNTKENMDFDGIIDEVRISDTVRDACWIETEYNNQDAPNSFYTVGSQTSVSAAYDQDSYRARNDNGGETTATWTVAVNTNWTQMVNKTFRLRFLVQETAGSADNNKTLQLEYNLNSGGWNDVTGSSSVVKATATANVVDAADTTQQLGSGTFVSTNAGFDEANGAVGGASLDFSGSDEVEVEFSLQIVSGDVSNGDTLQLRVKGLDIYTNTPTIAVTGAGTFSYKKSIVIQEAEVTCTANVSNFPVLVQLTGSDFTEVEDDVDTDGYDIIFKAEDDATCGGAGLAPCILDHEIELYDETNNLLLAWVRVPVLDYDDNTTIFLYYGNSAVTAATENPTGVWDDNYMGVWHLDETTGFHYDSTSYGNIGTPGGGVIQDANGKIIGADDFDGNDDRIEIDTTGLSTSNMTFSAWVKADALENNSYIFGHTTQPAYANRIQIYTSGTFPTLLTLGLGGIHNKDTGSALSTGIWYHVVFVKEPEFGITSSLLRIRQTIGFTLIKPLI